MEREEVKMKLKPHKERRVRSRVVLDLPLSYRTLDSCSLKAAIAVDGSETGLLIHSPKEIPVGIRLYVELLFADEFELSNVMAIVKVVRASRSENGLLGHRYGVNFSKVDDVNYRKLRHLLMSRRYKPGDVAVGIRSASHSPPVSGLRGCRRKGKKRPFRELLPHLLKILPL
jgi:hypothetical protein